MSKYLHTIIVLEELLSENEMEILNDALQCYGRHPDEHSYEEEIKDIREMAAAFDMLGYNHTLPQYDILTTNG